MFNAEPIQLLNDKKVFIQENTIGNTMQVAKIPEDMNEARISSFLGFICNDNSLPRQLTVQERYFILLNYLSISTSEYSDIGDNSEYFIETQDTPNTIEVGGIRMTHLYGYQVMMLEHKCENAYEWLCGQMAMQCYGDMGMIFGKDKNIVWEQITKDNQQELEKTFLERFRQIEQLTDNEFATFVDVFYAGCDELRHLVEIQLDNKGITLVSSQTEEIETVSQYGDKEVTEKPRVARFRPTSILPAIVENLAKCLIQ